MTKKSDSKRALDQQQSRTEVIEGLVAVVTAKLSRAQTPLARLWKQLDGIAPFYLVQCIAYYTSRVPEVDKWVDRPERLEPYRKAVLDQIRTLEKVLPARRTFEQLSDPDLGKISEVGGPSGPKLSSLSLVLEQEIVKLEDAAERLKKTLDERRQGVTGATRHLVMAQSYHEAWRFSRQGSLPLRSVELAELLEILDEHEGRRPDFNRAENVRKSIDNFKSNEDNAVLLSAIEKQVQAQVEQHKRFNSGSQTA